MITDTTPPALPEALDAALRRMRLPYLRRAAPDVLATARAQRWDPAEVVRVLIAEEIRGRDLATRTSRRKQAGLPAGKTFHTWRASPTPRSRRPLKPGSRAWNGSAGTRTWPSPGRREPARPTSSRPLPTRPSTTT